MADQGEEASSTRQQRRRRPRSAEAEVDSLPGRSRAVAPLVTGTTCHQLSAVPSALGERLHLRDRQLLSAPLRVDDADLFPLDQEPTYITQPPVPSLGGEGVERYAESMGRQQRFRRMPAQADGEQLSIAADREQSSATFVPPPPSGGTQAAFTLFGLAYHASGGMLAGITLAQSICSPGFDCNNLVLHMAYASVALTLQRAVTALSLFAFIGTADRHVCRRTFLSGLTVALTGLCVLLVALQLPPDAVFHHGRRERDPTLKIKHDEAGEDPAKLQLEDPIAFPEFILEESDTLFEMRLSCNLINYQQFLTLSRTLIALLAWVLACHEDPYKLFTVPPLERGPS